MIHIKGKNTFYSHLIKTENIHLWLKQSGLPNHKEEELLVIIQDLLHLTIIDVLIGKLPFQKRGQFLEIYVADPQDPALVDFIKTSGEDFELLVSSIVKEFENNLIEEIKALSG